MASRRDGQQMGRDVRATAEPSVWKWLAHMLSIDTCIDVFLPMSQARTLEKLHNHYEGKRLVNERAEDVDRRTQTGLAKKVRAAYEINPQSEATNLLSQQLRTLYLRRHRRRAVLQSINNYLAAIADGQAHLDDETLQREIAHDGAKLASVLQQIETPAGRVLGQARKTQREITTARGRLADINSVREDDAAAAADSATLMQGTAEEEFDRYFAELTAPAAAAASASVKSVPVPAIQARREQPRLPPIAPLADDEVTEVTEAEDSM